MKSAIYKILSLFLAVGLSGCAAIKLNLPPQVTDNGSIKDTKLELEKLKPENLNTVSDISYLILQTQYSALPGKPDQNDHANNAGTVDCKSTFIDRWRVSKYSAVVTAHLKKGGGSEVIIPIAIFERNVGESCKFTINPSGNLAFIKLESGQKNAIDFWMSYTTSEEKNVNWEKVLEDAKVIINTSANLASGGAAALLGATSEFIGQHEDQITNFTKLISPMVSRNDSTFVKNTLILEGNEVEFKQYKIKFQKYDENSAVPHQLHEIGNLVINFEITPTILVDEKIDGLPLFENKNLLTILEHKKINLKTLKEIYTSNDGNNKRYYGKITPFLESYSEKKNLSKLTEACEVLEDLSQKVELNLYDRAGLMYLLFSEYKDESAEKNWKFFSNSQNDVSISDLRKYKDVTDNTSCFNEDYLKALKKANSQFAIASDDIMKRIAAADDKKNNQIIKDLERISGDFLSKIRRINKGDKVQTELNTIVPRDKKIELENNLLDNETIQKASELSETIVGGESKFSLGQYNLFKLLNNLTIDVQNCKPIFIKDQNFNPTSIQYLANFTINKSNYAGVLELSIEQKRINKLIFHSDIQNFKTSELANIDAACKKFVRDIESPTDSLSQF